MKNKNYIEQIKNFWRKCFHLNFCLQITFSNNSIYIFPPQLTEFNWIKAIATPKMAINVKINTLNFDNKLKDCSSRRATEDHVTIRGYKAKLGLGFFKLTHWCLRSSQKCDRLGKPTKRSEKCSQTPKAKSTSSVEIAASSSNDNMASVRIHWLCWNLWETRAWGWCSILMGTSVRPPIKGHCQYLRETATK